MRHRTPKHCQCASGVRPEAPAKTKRTFDARDQERAKQIRDEVLRSLARSAVDYVAGAFADDGLSEAQAMTRRLQREMRRERALAAQRLIRWMFRTSWSCAVGSSRWAWGLARAVVEIAALERQRVHLLALSERGRKDIDVSIFDVEAEARRIRNRQAYTIWKALMGRQLTERSPQHMTKNQGKF